MDNFNFTYKVELDGKDILSYNPNLVITRLVTEDAEMKASTATITLLDPDLYLIDQIMKTSYRKVKVFGGFLNDQSTKWFDGVITIPACSFDIQGLASITLNCTDLSVLLSDTTERTWEISSAGPVTQKTDLQIANDILQSNGLKNLYSGPDTSTVNTTTVVKPQGLRDIDFLIDRATNNSNYTFYVVGSEAFFGPINAKDKSIVTLVRGSDPYNLISFSPVLNPTALPSSITGSQVDSTAGTTRTTTGSDSDKQKVGGSHELNPGGSNKWAYRPPTQTGQNSPVAPTAPDTNALQAQLNAAKANSSFILKATGTLLPTPYMVAKRNVVIAGVGSDLSGSWHVISVKNTISSSGWSQSFSVLKNNAGTTSPDNLPAEKKKTPAEDNLGHALSIDDQSWYTENLKQLKTE